MTDEERHTDESEGIQQASDDEVSAVPEVDAEQIEDETITDAVESGYVTTETSLDTDEDGNPAVTRAYRTAAFAEVADRPKREALDKEKTMGEIEFLDNLTELDPELSGTIRAQSQSAATGLSVTHPAIEGERSDMSDLEKEITKSCATLIDDLNIPKDAVTFFKQAVKFGDDITHIEYEEGDVEGEYDEDDWSGEEPEDEREGGVTDTTPLPLRLLTIVDEETARNGYYSQDTSSLNVSDKDFDRIITEAYEYVIVEERADARDTFPADDVLHISIDKRGNWYKDRLDRQTYSVWGETRLNSVKFAVQTKQNTLANKVAMDDKLLTREYYSIKVEELFGHIEDPQVRQEEVEKYANQLRQKLENLEADQKPIIPEEVEVNVEGPSGETARNQAEFIQTMTDSIQHALTYHVASFGRDAGGTDRGNKPAKEMSENSVRQLRDSVKTSFRKLFEIHAKLRFPEARVDGDGDSDTHTRYDLNPDIVLPTLKFDPVDPQDRNDEVKNAISLYEKGVADLNEARSEADLEPIDEEEKQEKMWFKNPTTPEEDEEQRQQEMEEQNQGPDGNPDESPVDEEDGPETQGPNQSMPTNSRPTDSDEGGEQ